MGVLNVESWLEPSATHWLTKLGSLVFLPTLGYPKDNFSYFEEKNNSIQDRKRPDGISYFPFKNGRCLAWDFTCPDTLARSHIKKSTEAGKAASRAEDGKLKKYRHLNEDYYVVPIGIETLGSFGPHAQDFIKDIGHRIMESTGEKKSTSYLMQTIGMAIQRGNSCCILETVLDSRKLDEVYYL